MPKHLRIAILFTMAALLAIAGFLFFTRSASTENDVQHRAAGAASNPAPTTPPAPGVFQQTKPAAAQFTERLSNPLERAPDLRSMYERYRGSNDASERNLAHRAWTACFPAFVAPKGQPVSLDMVTRALPQDAPNHAERVEAYRELLGRCKNFFDMSRDAIIETNRGQASGWKDGTLRAPGELAAKLLRAGQTAEAVELARTTIATQDPYSIYSLRDFMRLYLSAQNTPDESVQIQQPDPRAIAFYVVPCQMGMECGSDSLTALEMCAGSGECAGTVAERNLQMWSTQIPRDTVLQASQLVLQAIRTGNYAALGL